MVPPDDRRFIASLPQASRVRGASQVKAAVTKEVNILVTQAT
jgi:hypothetical protein